MTERHRLVLILVAMSRLLTAHQLRIAAFPLGANSSYSAQRVLTKMTRHSYLSTLPRYSPNEPLVYLLDRRSAKGINYLRQHWQQELEPYLTRLGSIPHTLYVSDIFVRIFRTCRDTTDLRFTHWDRDDLLQPHFLGQPLLPDAYAVIKARQRGQWVTEPFFLEVERAPKSAAAVEKRLRAYLRFVSSGEFERIFGHPTARLLVVFSDEPTVSAQARIKSGQQLAERLGVDFARFTSLAAIRQGEPSDILLEPLWYRPDRDTPVRLIRPS
jgi:hypothetical protein